MYNFDLLGAITSTECPKASKPDTKEFKVNSTPPLPKKPIGVLIKLSSLLDFYIKKLIK